MELGQTSPFHVKPRPLYWFNSDDCVYPWYGCKGGICLPPEWLCDGVVDCLDGEDEICSNVPKQIHYEASGKEKRELRSPGSEDHAVRSNHIQALGLMRAAHTQSDGGDLFIVNDSSDDSNETKLEAELSFSNSQISPNSSLTNETSFMPIIFPQILTTTQQENTIFEEHTTDTPLATLEISTSDSTTLPLLTAPSLQATTYIWPFSSSSFSPLNNETQPRIFAKSQNSFTHVEPSTISSFFSYPVDETTSLTTSNSTPISANISSPPSALPYFFTSTSTHSSYIHTNKTSSPHISTSDHTSPSKPSKLTAFQDSTFFSRTTPSTLPNDISTPLISLYDNSSFTSVSPTSNTSSEYLSPTRHSNYSLSDVDKGIVKPGDISTYLEILGQKYLVQVEKLSSITEELKTVKEHLITNLNNDACSCSRSQGYKEEKANKNISITKYTCLPHFHFVTKMCIYTHIYPPVTWLDAAYICKARNSRLLTLSSKAAFAEILSQLNRDKMQIYDFWIGATNRNTHKKWQWITGSNITTTDFLIPSVKQAYGDDSKSNQCGFMDRNFQLFINSSSCYEERGFICQTFPLIPKRTPKKVYTHP